MTLRLAYDTLAPQAVRALNDAYDAVHRSGLEPSLLNLVFMRISQINRCAYCLRLHGGDLRRAGETPERIDMIAAWHESGAFTPREMAALGWAESLTLITLTHACDADYAPAREVFDDVELANLSVAIALMNAFNRLAVGLRRPALS